MKNVMINKKKLVEVLTDNLTKHIIEYDKALIGYQKLAKKWYEKSLKIFKDTKEVRRNIEFPEPVDAREHYMDILEMLEYSVSTEVSLTELEFGMYIQDKWHWKNTRFDFAACGNVGIGTDAPDSTLFLNTAYARVR